MGVALCKSPADHKEKPCRHAELFLHSTYLIGSSFIVVQVKVGTDLAEHMRLVHMGTDWPVRFEYSCTDLAARVNRAGQLYLKHDILPPNSFSSILKHYYMVLSLQRFLVALVI